MIRLKVVYVDGSEQETTAGARAEVEFERKFGIAYSDAFHPRVKGEPRARLEWQYYMAWISLKLEGKVDEEFDDWLNRLDSYDVVESTSEDPTRRAQQPANSSS